MIQNTKTITICHKIIDPQTRLEKWIKKHYHDCWWFDVKGSVVRDGYQYNNRVEIRIPYLKNENAEINDIAIRRYIIQRRHS